VGKWGEGHAACSWRKQTPLDQALSSKKPDNKMENVSGCTTPGRAVQEGRQLGGLLGAIVRHGALRGALAGALLTSCVSVAAFGRAYSAATRWRSCRGPTTLWNTSLAAIVITSVVAAAAKGPRLVWCCVARRVYWLRWRHASTCSGRRSWRGPTVAGVRKFVVSWRHVSSGGCSGDVSGVTRKPISKPWRNNCSSQLCRPSFFGQITRRFRMYLVERPEEG
jgi:hypothetical protein